MPVDRYPAIKDATVRLYITEGEKKAELMNQQGLATIALPGVAMGHSKSARQRAHDLGDDREFQLHEDAVSFIMKDREVCTANDSPDMTENVDVIRATVRQAMMVLDAEAIPLVGYVPLLLDKRAAKAGVDDYFVDRRTAYEKNYKGDDLKNRVAEILDPDFSEPRPAAPHEQLEWLQQQIDDDDDDEFGQHLVMNPVATRKDVRRAVVRHYGRQMATWARVWFDERRDAKGWNAWLRAATKTFKLDNEHMLVKYTEHLGLRADGKAHRADPRKFVHDWVEHNRVVYSGGCLRLEGEPRSHDEIADKLILDGAATASDIRESHLERALREWTDAQPLEVMKRIRQKLEHRPDLSREPLSAFVRACTGRADTLDLAVVEHFLWLVKRLLTNRPTEHELMLVLHGKTGGGKSEAVTKLLQPLDDLVDYSADLSLFADDRQHFRVCECLVMFLDEMAKAGRADVGVLKEHHHCPERVVADARAQSQGHEAAARLLHRHHEPGPARTHIRPDEHEALLPIGMPGPH